MQVLKDLKVKVYRIPYDFPKRYEVDIDEPGIFSKESYYFPPQFIIELNELLAVEVAHLFEDNDKVNVNADGHILTIGPLDCEDVPGVLESLRTLT